MRPVNLIPTEDRPGQRRPMRGGPLAYIIVGALAFALLGVTLLVTTSNTISERESEITRIEGEVSTAEARVASLSAYTQFHQAQEQKTATITSLANSRFDWERVMRELALILPGNVWLTGLTASASGGGEGGLGVSGPLLNLDGCATSQAAVAGFINALKEIDGVTRVGMQGSTVGGGGGSTASSGSATGPGCPTTKEFIAQFEMTVAFDGAPVPSEEAGSEAAPAPAAPATEGGESTTESSEGEGATTSEPTSETSGEEG